MRRTLLSFVLSLLISVGWGQTYLYRYWIDNNVGGAVGGSATGEKQFNVSTSSLKSGIHAIHVQAMNADGKWSSVRTRYFLKEEKSANSSARYWIDNNLSAMHNGLATSGVIDLDISGLSNGIHAVHYQTIGTNGTPSTIRTRYFLIEKEQGATARYWIDNNMSTMHNDVAASGVIDLDISKLGVGVHSVHYQTISDGSPSTVRTRYFYVDRIQKSSLSVNISIDETVVDDYALSDEDILIDITELADGVHSIQVTLLDAQGKAIGQEEQEFEIIRKQPSPIIEFADATVKAICVEHWDTDGDGELNEEEAAAVTEIGVTFRNRTTITTFDEFRFFSGVTEIPSYGFSECSNLTAITFPDNLTTIYSFAFQNCSSLSDIELPNSLVYLWDCVFSGCNSLTSVTIPKNVYAESGSVYCSDSFSNCKNLSEIIVDPENPYLESIDNVLYTKDHKAIMQYPAGKRDTEYVIPEGITFLAGTFIGCEYLTSVKIPESITLLNGPVFSACT